MDGQKKEKKQIIPLHRPTGFHLFVFPVGFITFFDLFFFSSLGLLKIGEFPAK